MQEILLFNSMTLEHKNLLLRMGVRAESRGLRTHNHGPTGTKKTGTCLHDGVCVCVCVCEFVLFERESLFMRTHTKSSKKSHWKEGPAWGRTGRVNHCYNR